MKVQRPFNNPIKLFIYNSIDNKHNLCHICDERHVTSHYLNNNSIIGYYDTNCMSV